MAVDIAAENALTTGRTPYTETAISGAGDTTVAGFARQISVDVGDTVQFSVTGGAVDIDIYRLGYYGGDGWRLVDSITNTPTTQPAPTSIANSNGAVTCTNWSVTASWAVPAGATSGMYVALIRSVAPQAPNAFWAPFVVRDDAATADIIYKTSDTTWAAAYNYYGGPAAPLGGKNLYGQNTAIGDITQRAHAVSYHRPIITRQTGQQTYFQACEVPLIRWLERQGFTIKYVTSLDLDQTPGLLDSGTIFLSSGHDEYWTTPMRDAVEDYRDAGGRSVFMSGNEVFWRSRFEIVSGEPRMWCYKDTMPGPGAHVAGQALDPVTWTGTWKDTRWANNKPEWLLTGTDFRMNGINDFDATIVKNPYAGHKVWGGSSLNDGDITIQKIIGFEADEVRATQPTDSVRLLAAYTRTINGAHADDNGQVYTGNGDLEWGIVSQRYLGGGLTVGFGTCQWSWALDAVHDRGAGTPVSLAAQQFTLNLLTDLGATATTLQSGLLARDPEPLDEYGLEPPAEPPPPTVAFYLGDGRLLSLQLGDGTPLTPEE